MLAVLTCLVLSACASQSDPPVRFTGQVTNPFFPLRVGATWRYRGVQDGKTSVDVVRVLSRRRMIEGISATVVLDRLWLAGRLEERTLDYFAQDGTGNVWYLGEDTAELDRRGRVVSRDGSWRAGRDGGRPGVLMPAHPRVGDGGLQEFLRGQAEDHYRVVSVSPTVVRTVEWSPLEPGVLDSKSYRRGVGGVREVSLRGPREFSRLVGFTKGQ